MEKAAGRAQEIQQSFDQHPTETLFLLNAFRYLLAAERLRRNEDRLINLFIALEALYSDRSGELSYKLSNRMASLLARTDQERGDIFEHVRDLYDKRSKIIHGDLEKVTNEDMVRLSSLTKHSLTAVFRLLRLYQTRKKILPLIDRALHDSSLRRKIQAEAGIFT
jgi:UDP-2,3-diacylglucosamine pyrophosphatase LpxH